MSFAFVASGHKDGVVDGGAELDGANTDGSDEREGVANVIRNSEIDEDGHFDKHDENDGERNTASDQSNNEENDSDGNGIDDLEVVRSEINHILSAAGFADEKG